MQVILSDHNCDGQADALYKVLEYDKTWLELAPMEIKRFHDVTLSIRAPDEEVWKLCQRQRYLLLTGNRSGNDKDASLESAIRRLFKPTSLPVLTIGNLKRINSDPIYRRLCAERLAEIVYDLEDYRGIMCLYLP